MSGEKSWEGGRRKNLSLGNVKSKAEIMYFSDHTSQFNANVSSLKDLQFNTELYSFIFFDIIKYIYLCMAVKPYYF